MTDEAKKPSDLKPKVYNEFAEFTANRITALTPAGPAAVLSRDALSLLQSSKVKHFWQQTETGELEPIPVEVMSKQALAALNLRVGNEMILISPDKKIEYKDLIKTAESHIPPGHLAIIKSLEYLCMPPFLMAFLVTPVTSAIAGISNVSTMIDPLFEGFLVLNFVNPTQWKINIRPGMVISRGVFHMVAHIGKFSTEEGYTWGHKGLLKLEDIMAKRVKDTKEEKRAYSKEIVEILEEWLKNSKGKK